MSDNTSEDQEQREGNDVFELELHRREVDDYYNHAWKLFTIALEEALKSDHSRIRFPEEFELDEVVEGVHYRRTQVGRSDAWYVVTVVESDKLVRYLSGESTESAQWDVFWAWVCYQPSIGAVAWISTDVPYIELRATLPKRNPKAKSKDYQITKALYQMGEI